MGKFILVGAPVTNVFPKIGGVKEALRSTWSRLGGVMISHYKRNIFTITSSRVVANKILDDDPWNIMNFCFNMVAWPLELTLDKVLEHMVQYWVQISSFTMEKMNASNARLVGAEMVAVIYVEDLVASKAIM